MSGVDEQGMVEVPGGRVWWRRVGDGPGTPLLLLHGGPGMSSAGSAEWLGDLPETRPVVFYDQLGGGRSDRPRDPSLWTVDRFVAELAAVRTALGLDEVVLHGRSWGTMLATSYLATSYSATRPTGVRGLVLSSPCLNARQWARDQLDHLAALPVDVRATIERCERDGCTATTEYDAAMRVFYARHLCRLDPWPAQVEQFLADLNPDVYGRMWGSSEWHVTGTLADFDARPVLADIEVPVLFTAGEHDEATPATIRAQAALVADAEVHVFPGASHLTYVEMPDAHRSVVAGFLARRGL